MAYTYENLPLLSKVKIGEQTYYLKDAEVRKILDTFGTAVTYNVDTTFNAESGNLATSAAVATYLEGAIAGLTGAMHFVGVEEELPATGNNGDIVIVGSAEYVWSDEKAGGAGWILIGDEGVYATIAGVDAAYVKKTLTIAGIDLNDAITADELKTALGLKALAYKDTASGSVDVVTGVKDASYTPAGNVGTTLTHTSTAMASSGSFTPAGSVSGNVTAAGTVAISRDDVNGVQVSGTVSAPTITVTPATAEVQHISSLGTLPSYTAAQYVAPSVTEAKAQFASEGLLASVDAEETLIFTAAGKADALTATGFNAGSYVAAEFNAGALPELGAAQVVVTGITKAEASAPVFTGDKFGATFSGSEVAIAATFAGSEGAVSVSGNYDKATSAASTFEGAAATITHEVTTGTKTVTVQ